MHILKTLIRYMAQISYRLIMNNMPSMLWVGTFDEVTVYHCEGVTLTLCEQEHYSQGAIKDLCRVIGVKVHAISDNLESIDLVEQKLQKAIKANRK